jgi:hypothetical protein
MEKPRALTRRGAPDEQLARDTENVFEFFF